MRVRRVVTTRAGGRSTGPFARFNLSAGVGDDPVAVAANRRRLADELGVRGVVFLGQVHGTQVAVVDAVPRPGEPDRPGTDAAVTALPGVALAVLTADCVPVLLADPQAGVVGVAHAGRVGAAAGVLPATLKAMAGLGAHVADCEVLLGPAVCGGLLRGARGDARRGRGRPAGQRRPDPPRHARPGPAGRAARPARRGRRRRIGVDPRCTVEDPDLYSYRRDRRTGRLAAVTWLDPVAS